MIEDRWLTLPELSVRFGISERLLATVGLPLRKVSHKAIPGLYESELKEWIAKNGLPVGDSDRQPEPGKTPA